MLQRSSRIIAGFGGDGLDYIEKRGSRSGGRPELLYAEFLEAINVVTQLTYLGLSCLTFHKVGPPFFPRLNYFSFAGFSHRIFRGFRHDHNLRLTLGSFPGLPL